MKFKYFILVVCWLFPAAKCLKILGVFSFPAKSHYILGNALMKGLAEAGHDVTIITPHLDLEPPKNGTYTNVYLSGFLDKYKTTLKSADFVNFKDANSVMRLIAGQFFLFHIVEDTLSHSNVQNLLNSGENFDLVIAEKFYNDAFFAFAHHYKAPLIIFSALRVSPCINNIVGNPEPYSYIPHYVSTFSPEMSFFERMYNSFIYVGQEVSDQLYFLPKHEAVMKKYFPDAPSIYDLYSNVSLVFVSSHESFFQSVPVVPNIKLVGGFHVKPPKRLPDDLQKFLDNSPEGVVYFCLGSNVKTRQLPIHKRNMLLRAFSRLKEKVLMKWEEDHLEGQPTNVVVKKWLPQSDVLAHPNIKLFISHGGLLGTTEAIYHGVPMLVMPFFGDQHSNAKTAVTSGYGLSLAFVDPEFSEEKLFSFLQELLHNPKYRENAISRSRLFHDRPLSPMDTIKYWVEYVVRHKGAPHLRVTGIQLPWYKYHLIDIICFILAITIIVFYLIYVSIKFVVRLSQKQPTKIKKKKS